LVHSVPAFLALVVLLTVTPGPDDVLVLSRTALGGARAGAAVAAGAVTGTLVWGVAAATGLAAVVVPSTTAYQAVRLAGAVYLMALGAVPLLAPVVRRVMPAHPMRGRHRPTGAAAPATTGPFSVGLLGELLNPKIAVFYLAVLPQFVPAAAPVLPYSLLLCAIDVTVAVTWLLLLVGLADRVLSGLRRPRVDAWLQRSLQACLLGVGAAVAVGT
jgi:threonine/homoserine/homoserine lactone efflux protein